MPSIYAHEKFGRMVFQKLKDAEQKIINKFPKAYQIGLQGPDFLFFYRAFCKNKINKKGVFYHHQDAYIFMKNALKVIKKYGKDSSQYSYILGFICHLTLDDACHPYVSEAMRLTDCGHAEIEGDLDQLILTEDGYLPHKYQLAELVPEDINTAKSICPFYRGLSLKTVHQSLKWMRLIKKFFYAPGIIKRTIIDLLMRMTFHYKKLNGHLVFPKENKKCRRESEHLYRMLKEAVPKGVRLIEDFNHALDGEPLSGDFHKDFYGNKIGVINRTA